MILLRRLSAEAERCTRADVLVRRWLEILWSKGVEGVVLKGSDREWRAGTLGPSAELLGSALVLHGSPRLEQSERVVLGVLAATLAAAFSRMEKLATQARRAHRKQLHDRGAALTGDLTRLLEQLEKRVERPNDETFDAHVEAILRRALRLTRGKIYGPDGAAALLDLPPTTLQSKLKKHGIRS